MVRSHKFIQDIRVHMFSKGVYRVAEHPEARLGFVKQISWPTLFRANMYTFVHTFIFVTCTHSV